ncbi:MAG: glycine zipper 2TM domain-containing protein [Novosphingobium sp.]
MHKLIIGAALAAVSVPVATSPALAQYNNGPRYNQELRECNRELRRTDSRRDHYRELRECRRELAKANQKDWKRWNRYDYNRYEPGQSSYYADRYYRDGRYYTDRRLTRSDRIYRGNDDRYYCRRNDGTTGLIIGGAVGALLGREIDRGDSRLAGTLIGGGAGALLGREIERGSLRCN